MNPTREPSMEVERDEFALSREDVENYQLTVEERDGPSFATEAEAAEYYPPFIAHAYTHLQGIFPQLPPDLTVYPLLQSFREQYSQDTGVSVQSILGNPKDLGIVCKPDAQNQHYEKVMFGNKRESSTFATSKAILALALVGTPVIISREIKRTYLLEILSYFIAKKVDKYDIASLLTSLTQGNDYEAQRKLVLLMEKYSVDVLSLHEFEDAFRSLCIRVLRDPNILFEISSKSKQDLLVGFLGNPDNIAYAYKYYVLRKKGRATRDRMTEIVQRNAALHASAAALAEAVQLHTTTRAAEVVHTPFPPITIEEGAEKLPTVQEVQQVFEDAFREAEALKGIHGTYSKPTVDRMLAIGRSHSALLLAQHTDTIALADLEAMCAEVLFVMMTEYHLFCPTNVNNPNEKPIYVTDCSRSISAVRKPLDAMCVLYKTRYVSLPTITDTNKALTSLNNKYSDVLKIWGSEVHQKLEAGKKMNFQVLFGEPHYNSTRLFFFGAFSQCLADQIIDTSNHMNTVKERLRSLNREMLLATFVKHIALAKSPYTLPEIQERAGTLFQQAVRRHQAENVDGSDADDAMHIPYGPAMKRLEEAKLEDVTRAMILSAIRGEYERKKMVSSEYFPEKGITSIPESIKGLSDFYRILLYFYIEEECVSLSTQIASIQKAICFSNSTFGYTTHILARKFGITAERTDWDTIITSIDAIKKLCGITPFSQENGIHSHVSNDVILQLVNESAQKTFSNRSDIQGITTRLGTLIAFGLKTLAEAGIQFTNSDVISILQHTLQSRMLYISGDPIVVLNDPTASKQWDSQCITFTARFLQKLDGYFKELERDRAKKEALNVDTSSFELSSHIATIVRVSPILSNKIFKTASDNLRFSLHSGTTDGSPERQDVNTAFQQFRNGARDWIAQCSSDAAIFPINTVERFRLFVQSVAYGISVVSDSHIQSTLRTHWQELFKNPQFFVVQPTKEVPLPEGSSQQEGASEKNVDVSVVKIQVDSTSNTINSTPPQDPLLECLEALGANEAHAQTRILEYCIDRLDQGAANLLALSLSTTNQGDIEAMTLELQSFLQHATELLQEAIATCVQTSGTMTHAVMQNVVANVSTSIASSAPTGGTHFSSSSLASLVLSVIEELMLCERAKDYLELFDAQQSSTPPLSSSADDVSVTYPRLEAVKRTAQRRKQEAAERAVAVQRQRRMKEEVPQRLQEARNRLESLLALLTDVGERASAGDESAEYDAIHIPAGIDTIYHLITATRGRPQ